jgi:hypothetical protein
VNYKRNCRNQSPRYQFQKLLGFVKLSTAALVLHATPKKYEPVLKRNYDSK